MAAWQQKVDAWKKTASAADVQNFDAGKGVVGAPGKPEGAGSRSEPSSLYNGMIAPLTGYSLRGIVANNALKTHKTHSNSSSRHQTCALNNHLTH